MSNISPERFLESEKKIVALEVEYKDMMILDIGGGGEGIIGKLYGRNVVAIDPLLRELEETSNQSIKIVMDACDMKFTSNFFDVATSFFTFMYMNKAEKEKSVSEIKRVLKPGGIFEIWDTKVPIYDGGKKDIYVLRLQVNLPTETISTGYGTKMTEKGQDLLDIKNMLIANEFKIIECDESDGTVYRIKCTKP